MHRCLKYKACSVKLVNTLPQPLGMLVQPFLVMPLPHLAWSHPMMVMAYVTLHVAPKTWYIALAFAHVAMLHMVRHQHHVTRAL